MTVVNIGETNRLAVVRIEAWGYVLEGGGVGEILLPNKHAKGAYAVGELVEVFIYLDSEDAPAATTQTPLGQVNRFAYLKVADVNPVGAFLDWGLPKQLLVPYDEQRTEMFPGESYLVYIYRDKKTGRIVASTKIDRFVKAFNDAFQVGLAVDLMVQSLTDIGYKCIVNHSHYGMLFYDDVFERLSVGQQLKGYIKNIREDGKIDLSVTLPGYQGVEAVCEAILEALRAVAGFIPVNDKSPPEEIYSRFGVSKQTFKKAVGSLYKRRLITLEKHGIRLKKTGS